MSLDISLYTEDIDGNEMCVFDSNMTHNVTPMWREAGCYDALYQSDGKKAKDVAIDICNAVELMESDPKTFKRLNSPNGWGTYKQALPWLKEVKEAVMKYPSATIQIWK